MKWICLMLFSLTSLVSVGQESDSKWFHTARVDVLLPTKVIYKYKISSVAVGEIALDKTLITRLLYSYNHWLIKDKFSFGVLSGVQFFSNPQLLMLELGGEFRISVLKKVDAYMLLQTIYHQWFNRNNFNGGLDFCIALELPVYHYGNNAVLFGIGLGSGLLSLEDTNYKSGKVQGNQDPLSVNYNTFTWSLGLKF